MKKESVRSLTYISLSVAMIAVLSQLVIPIGAVPLTIQAFVIAMIGYFLGLKKGLISVLVYILLGVVGVPVFAGFQGGAHIIISYTGGFILGFLPFVVLCGTKAKRFMQIPLGIIGLLLCHLMGIMQYMLLSELSFIMSFVAVSLPFIIKDILLVIGAYFVSSALKKRIAI